MGLRGSKRKLLFPFPLRYLLQLLAWDIALGPRGMDDQTATLSKTHLLSLKTGGNRFH